LMALELESVLQGIRRQLLGNFQQHLSSQVKTLIWHLVSLLKLMDSLF